MNRLLVVFAVIAVNLVTSMTPDTRTSTDRITSYNYPCETHTVQTTDGYLLTIFRIPYSPKLKNQDKRKPVVLIQHGLASVSDHFLLNGPDNAIPYLFVDAGYDVWLGNNRGTNYGMNHTVLSPKQKEFWDFSFNQIAIYDLPATIDYILAKTQNSVLHYVGHSQGTTILFVLMASRPEYNKKVTSSHLLAPVAYINHARSPLFSAIADVINNKTAVAELIGDGQLNPSQKLFKKIGQDNCLKTSPYAETCNNLLFLGGHFTYNHTNFTLVPELLSIVTPASTKQLIHFTQDYISTLFRNYDYGPVENLIVYGQSTPPSYNESNIVTPLYMYYSDNDYFADVKNVLEWAKKVHPQELFRAPYPDWTHFDFLWSNEVKDMYEKIISICDRYENAKL